MFKGFFNYAREIRRRRADLKANPEKLVNLDFSKLLAESQEKRDRLWENPPPCGPVIRYVQEYAYEESHGEFLFQASDIEQAIKNILIDNPHLANSDEGAILNWVQRRDETHTEPSNVPTLWSRFQYIADDLVRTGKADIHCRECNSSIRTDEIIKDDDSGRPSWNFNRVKCPNGHNLLVVESAHIIMS